MHRSFLALSITGIMVLLLMSACAKESENTVAAEVKKASVAQTTAAKKTAKAVGQDAPIMNQPVDFSTPEAVAKTMKNISEQAGGRVTRRIDSVMGYMMTYDLGVGRDEDKMYKKLHGKTPNQIIAMGTARG